MTFLQFMLTTDGLIIFLKYLNQFSKLKFTWNISKEKVTVLDVGIFFKNGQLKKKLHIKRHQNMQYLDFITFHPIHVKKTLYQKVCLKEYVMIIEVLPDISNN